ncbi:ficolin, putative, partial [Ixodes scapularis]
AGKGYDALSGHNGSEFTVKKYMGKSDQDTCFRETLTGGWWFKRCNEANLNGRKLTLLLPTTKPRGITWNIQGDIKAYDYTYEKVEMKIRDADFGFCTGFSKS